jgi:two-component system, NarL family, nitrate/nitrite response regulator NarL
MEHKTPEIHVLLLEDSLIHAELLAEALRRSHALDVLSAVSGNAAIRAALNFAIDVLVISSALNEQNGRWLEVLREVRASRPDIRAVVLVDSSAPEVLLEAFRAGARGLFSRCDSVEMLCKCIQSVYAGQIWANSQELAIVLEAFASVPTVRAVGAKGLNLLTKREMEIVQALTEGLTNRQIAEKLRLSQHTVKNYLFRIFDKLGVSTRVELLFMTLSQDTHSQSVFSAFLKRGINEVRDDDPLLKECQHAAEQGSLMAQLVLGQVHWTRGGADLVLACMWYLIARARILEDSKNLKAVMSLEQLLQAEKMAAEWLEEKESLLSIRSVSERIQSKRVSA